MDVLMIAALAIGTALILRAARSGDGTVHYCNSCDAQVWNDHEFPNHGHVTLSARELGMRSLPQAIAEHDGEIVCVVCRNRFSAQYGDGNTV